MSARGKVPSRHDVVEKLSQLVADDAARGEIADWARPWASTRADEIADIGVLRAIERLASADMPTTDRDYLYGREDFKAWLDDLT